MNVSVLKTDLSKALKAAAPIAKRAQLPGLHNIRLVVEAGALHVQATDVEIMYDAAIIADPVTDAVTDAVAVVDPAELKAALAAVTTDGVELSTTGDHLLVGANSVKLHEDYFTEPTTAGGSFKLSGDLKPALRVLIKSLGKDITRPCLTGVNFRQSGDRVVLFSTDGYRFTRAAVDGDGFDNVTVPGPAIKLLYSLLTKDSNLTGAIDDNMVQFDISGPDPIRYSLTARLIDQRYIDYQTLWKDRDEDALTVDAPSLREVIATGKLELSSDGDNLAIAHDGSTVKLPARGAIKPLKLNGAYLKDALIGATGDVTIKTTGTLIDPVFIGRGDIVTGVMQIK